jgi:hypothetical protein
MGPVWAPFGLLGLDSGNVWARAVISGPNAAQIVESSGKNARAARIWAGFGQHYCTRYAGQAIMDAFGPHLNHHALA